MKLKRGQKEIGWEWSKLLGREVEKGKKIKDKVRGEAKESRAEKWGQEGDGGEL